MPWPRRWTTLEISVVIPLFNEEESVSLLHERVTLALQKLGLSYEIILVDDGSTDSTVQLAAEIASTDPNLRIFRFRRNYGQTPAMAAGIDFASGEWIVTMDGDLQNDPGDIGLLIDKLKEGNDLAVGWRHDRQDKMITRKIPSKIANWIIGHITGIPIKDNGCSLKAYRAEVIQQIPLYSDMHRFIPAMASISGARVAEVRVRHHARQFGESKYGLGRVYKVLVDLLSVKTIISFSHRPLVWFSLLAVPAFAVGILSLVHVLGGMISDGTSTSVPIAGTGVLFVSLGIFLVLNGALAELVYRTGDLDLTSMAKLTASSGGKSQASIHERTQTERSE